MNLIIRATKIIDPKNVHHGKVVEFQETNQLFANPQTDYTKALMAAAFGP